MLRNTFRWTRAWLRTSKPTEWISSIATFAGVAVAITTGVLVYNSGLFDTKRSELNIENAKLEIRRAELSIQNLKLEAEQKEQNLRIAANEKKLTETKTALYARIEHDRAIQTLARLNMPQSDNLRMLCDVHLNAYSGELRLFVRVPSHMLRFDAKPLAAKSDKKIVFDSIPKLANLTDLSFFDIQLDSDDLMQISQVSSLRWLSLRNCGLNDESIAHLTVPPNVTSLTLWRNPITHLPPITNKEKIEVLNLTETLVSDESISRLLPNMSGLKWLGLASTPITDQTIDAITIADLHCQLEYTKTTPDGIKRLMKRTRPRFVSHDADADADYRKFIAAEALPTKMNNFPKKR